MLPNTKKGPESPSGPFCARAVLPPCYQSSPVSSVSPASRKMRSARIRRNAHDHLPTRPTPSRHQFDTMNLPRDVLGYFGLCERHRHVGPVLPGIPVLQRYGGIGDREREAWAFESEWSADDMGSGHLTEFAVRSISNASICQSSARRRYEGANSGSAASARVRTCFAIMRHLRFLNGS